MCLRLIFNFYDYDNNGSIGSVDITNLEKHFDFDYLDQILKAFTDERIRRDITRHFALRFTCKSKEEFLKKEKALKL